MRERPGGRGGERSEDEEKAERMGGERERAKMNILRMKREASQEKKKSAKRLRLDNINNNIA